MADLKKPTFHHLNNSQSQRIFWLLEELRLATVSTPNPFDYTLILHKRVESGPNKQRAPSEMEEIHPLGKAPQLVTPEGRVIVESSAIAKYLIDTFDYTESFKGDRNDPVMDGIRDDQLTSFANASIAIPMMIEMFLEMLVVQSPFFIRPIFKGAHGMVHKMFSGPEFDKMFKYLNGELEGREWFMGGPNPGRADIMISWPVDFCVARKYVDLSRAELENLRKWRERYLAREAWKSAMEKGNGYRLSAF